VHLYDDAVRNAGIHFQHAEPLPIDQLPIYPTINQVSTCYKLNKDQHNSFAIFASALLQTWKARHIGQPENDDAIRIKHVMSGAGGTGKSEVIKALISFCELWLKPQAVRTIAATGIAAVNVFGRTIHSSLNLSIKVPKGGHEKKPVDKALKNFWYYSVSHFSVAFT